MQYPIRPIESDVFDSSDMKEVEAPSEVKLHLASEIISQTHRRENRNTHTLGEVSRYSCLPCWLQSYMSR